jgi:hypothetical protein
VIVSVVLAGFVSGVIVAGLNAQFAIAGNPLHTKLIGLPNDPCGVAVKVNVPVCPAGMVIVVGVELKVNSAALTWKLWLTATAAA